MEEHTTIRSGIIENDVKIRNIFGKLAIAADAN